MFFCTLQVVSLAVDTGSWEVVANGGRAAISPDGQRLAYVGRGGGKDCTQTNGPIVVRDLDTGKERKWSVGREPSGIYGEVVRLAWSPDARYLAVERNIGDPSELRLLDTSKGDDDQDARLLSPKTESWGYASFLDANTLLIASGKKGDNVDGQNRIHRLKLDTGQREAIVAMPSPVTSIDFDSAQKSLLIVLLEYLPDGLGRSVWAWRDGRLARIVPETSAFNAFW